MHNNTVLFLYMFPTYGYNIDSWTQKRSILWGYPYYDDFYTPSLNTEKNLSLKSVYRNTHIKIFMQTISSFNRCPYPYQQHPNESYLLSHIFIHGITHLPQFVFPTIYISSKSCCVPYTISSSLLGYTVSFPSEVPITHHNTHPQVFIFCNAI